MELRSLALPEVIEVSPKKFGDERGYFSEIFRQDWFCKNVAEVDFVQENQSLSAKNGTIRGLHFQTDPFAQGKLVRCLAGAIFDVAVDLRAGSPRYGQWTAVELTAEKGNQLWIPAGFGHGFCTLLPDTIVCYKVTAYYSPEHDSGVAWDDKDIAVVWPEVADASSLSAKDQAQPRFADLPAYSHYEG
ncbi:MAG: dTDP-4-dehydrorhamnose 3,5-epimerase [Alphaproteobacteria bacterium]|nr:dTDP-4-dehydrorhamnose 3,5-epimerase [Alphaproteobacteria bacterium]